MVAVLCDCPPLSCTDLDLNAANLNAGCPEVRSECCERLWKKKSTKKEGNVADDGLLFPFAVRATSRCGAARIGRNAKSVGSNTMRFFSRFFLFFSKSNANSRRITENRLVVAADLLDAHNIAEMHFPVVYSHLFWLRLFLDGGANIFSDEWNNQSIGFFLKGGWREWLESPPFLPFLFFAFSFFLYRLDIFLLLSTSPSSLKRRKKRIH